MKECTQMVWAQRAQGQ